MFCGIRGTFGSGKTTVVRGLIKLLEQAGGQVEIIEVPIEGKKNPVKFAQKYSNVQGLDRPVILLGTYGEIACCGADQLNWKGSHDTMRDFIREQAEHNHMLIEGSIASNSRGYLKVAKELQDTKDVRSVFLHLNTPVEECIRRVIGRRDKNFAHKYAKALEKGKEALVQKEFNPDNLHKLFNNIKRVKEFTVEFGMPYLDVDSSVETSQMIFDLFKKDDRRLQLLELDNAKC